MELMDPTEHILPPHQKELERKKTKTKPTKYIFCLKGRWLVAAYMYRDQGKQKEQENFLCFF
jgi:hypothetical protein